MLSISSVARDAWTLQAHQTPPNQPGSGSGHTNTMAVFIPIWSHTWPQWSVPGATHEYDFFMDPCCPYQVQLDILGPFHHPKYTQISLDQEVPTQTPCLFSESYEDRHGPNEL
jgi:hypothetical protein